MFKSWIRKRRTRKIKPGNGSALRPYHWWQLIGRSLFFLRREDESGVSHVYAVDIDYFSWEYDALLYKDGVQHEKAPVPAVFPVPGGVIEASMSSIGLLTRMHFVAEDGSESVLQPHRLSAEGLRARFAQRFPRASSAVGWVAVAVLLIGLVFAGPQLLEMVTQLEWVAATFGTFTSPFSLPGWLGTTLFVAGMLATLERALTFRSHWLIDAETWWIG